MTTATQLVQQGEGRCAISGALTLQSVPGLWQLLQSGGLLTTAREADLAGVTDADSAGLALLVAWRCSCAAAGNSLELRNLPKRILALAQLTRAETALGAC